MMAPRLSPCWSRWASPLRRLPGVRWICAATLVSGAALAWAQAPKATDGDTGRPPPATADDQSTASEGDRRMREGTQIADRLGHFRMTGGRVTFFTADGKRRLVGLENLNLERIARTIADSPRPLQWTVTGTVTEYRGVNFLLVRRAILKSRSEFRAGGF